VNIQELFDDASLSIVISSVKPDVLKQNEKLMRAGFDHDEILAFWEGQLDDDAMLPLIELWLLRQENGS
jgi:hypothetical protein